jgi:hypothetical protein
LGLGAKPPKQTRGKVYKGQLTYVTEMKRVDAYIPDELEQRFREEVFKRYGLRKGNLSQALEAAIRLWVENGKREEKVKEKVPARVK